MNDQPIFQVFNFLFHCQISLFRSNVNNFLCPLIIINALGLVDLKIIDLYIYIYIYIYSQYVKRKEMWWLMLYLKENG